MQFRVAAVSLVVLAACAQGSGGDEVDGRTVDATQDLVDAQATDARLDAAPMATDAGVDAAAGDDTCAQAQDITAGALMVNGITVTGNTTGYADDVRFADSVCTGFLPDGPDAIYSVTVNAGVTITAVATPTTNWDISLELVQPCTLVPTCLDGADANITGAETATFTTTAQGTYFIVVDGYNPGVAGPFSLNVRVQ